MRNIINRIIIIMLTMIMIVSLYSLMDRHLPSEINRQEAGKIRERIIAFFRMQPHKSYETLNYKAVWVSYLDVEAYRTDLEEKGESNDEEHFSKYAEKIASDAEKAGLTHVIFQVRPFGDALYESDVFPWSASISGSQGLSPGYDPLAIMIKACHRHDLKLEAWINPYRITAENHDQLSNDNPACTWINAGKRHVLEYNGRLYYNPASSQAQMLIKKGVQEIVNNYKVDGIHMDDYFYPTFTRENVRKSFDYVEYEGAIRSGLISKDKSIYNWRRDNVSTLLKDTWRIVKEEDTDITFGISPNGNLDNLRSDLQHYADIDLWASETGYVDYMIPQIYWGFDDKDKKFDRTVDEWAELVKDSQVELYVGLPVYRLDKSALVDPADMEFNDSGVIEKMKQYLEKNEVVTGYALFSYRFLDLMR
ncbi:MAG: family 10 glycosylhydrolase [Eubacterium sp.]|nr:family 10 glycosylhydrolase [Eubacterium sp.]